MSELFAPSENDPNGIKATKRPFPRPKRDDPLLLWYIDKSSPSYKPFIARITERAGSTMKFVLLHKETGEDAHKKVLELDVRDYPRAYCDIPASLHDADPNDSARNCGFLMLSLTYIEELERDPEIGSVVIELTQGSGKWPRGVASLYTAVSKLVTSSEVAKLSGEERAAVTQLLSLLV